MLRPLCTVVLVLASLAAHAQEPVAPRSARGDRAPVRVTAGVEVQSVSGGPSQVVLPFALEASLGGGVRVGGQTSYAWAVAPGGLEGPAGLGDVQASASYARAVGRGSVVATLGANLPVGQRRLTAEEAATAYLVGQSFYGFPLTTWGQGMNVSPGVAVAWPLAAGVALGAAAAFQSRGAFAPLAATAAELDPGDELLLTVGADVRLGRAAVAAIDVTGVRYGTDHFDGVTYDVGDALLLTGTLEHAGERGRARLLARVRLRGEGEPPPVAAFRDTTVPFSFRLQGEASTDVGGGVGLGVVGRARRFDASAAFPSYTLFEGAVVSRVAAGRGLTLQTHLGGLFGDLEGLVFGASVSSGL